MLNFIRRKPFSNFRLVNLTTFAAENYTGNLRRNQVLNDLLKSNETKYTIANSKLIKVELFNKEIFCNTIDNPTPFNLMIKENKSHLKNSVIIAKVNGVLWDLNRPLFEDSHIEFLFFDNLSARQAFWRSSGFIINRIIEQLFNGQSCQSIFSDIGMGGFISDFFLPQNRSITSSDLVSIEERFSEIVHQNVPLERFDISLDMAMEMFVDNPYKLSSLNNHKTNNSSLISCYRCFDFIDLCQAPLVMETGQLKYMKLTGNGSIKSEFDTDRNSLQRVFGISFPNENLYHEWEKKREEEKNRDHRVIGRNQKLFFFHHSSPGSAFMLPNGTHICNKLIDLIRESYKIRGFLEVSTPQLFHSDLWKISGHWNHYQKNLFKISSSDRSDLDTENDRLEERKNQIMTLKPMNCPAHCLIYDMEDRSYDDLPLRFADFGALHRNESTSTLNGLTRVCKFHQDDAHIFCRYDQIEKEIRATLEFLHHIYNILDLKYSLTLSTRPDTYLGDAEMWNVAEQVLKKCLDESFPSTPWSVSEGDGAFYGPKIDVSVTDAVGRHHQCGTIQLDFQLPLRFNLKYRNSKKAINLSSENFDRPVLIHRAILGSIERFFAILIESYGGRWPFWLNPRQVLVVPVFKIFATYAKEICQRIKTEGFMCDVNLTDDSEMSFNKKIRLGQLQQYNCILVIGQKEVDNGQVSLRTRDGKIQGSWEVYKLIEKLKIFNKNRIKHIENHFYD